MNSVPKYGISVVLLVATFIFSAMGALLFYAPSVDISQIWQDPYLKHVTKFSIYQALLSTLLSVGLAIPIALALYRRRFWGRTLLIRLFSTTLVLPVLVGVFGILSIYGNSGLLAEIATQLGYKLPFSIYGLNGIVLAHLFFNLPYASRLFLQTLEAIPSEQHKLCIHFGMNHWDKFKWVEWPRLRQQIPSIGSLVFMLCFTSFTTVMVLGGGPKATTIELAIYQAIKFDFDLQMGALLALWQVLLCSVFYLSLQWMTKSTTASIPITHQTIPVIHRDSVKSRYWDSLWIGFIMTLLLPPLLAVMWGGINLQFTLVFMDHQFWQALKTSLEIAVLASAIALASGISIIMTYRAWIINGHSRQAHTIEFMGSIILVAPSVVLSTGIFLLLRNVMDVFGVAYWIVVMVNGLMALPYVLKTLSQPMLHLEQQYCRLCATLGIKGWRRLKMIEFKALNRPMGYAFTISFLLSMGDLSVIALFGHQDLQTLSYYLFQLLGSYQMKSASVVAFVLLMISVSGFILIERLFTINSRGSRRVSVR